MLDVTPRPRRLLPALQAAEPPGPPASPFGELLYSYTRAQALADGLLIDVTAQAREAGFTVPVAITIAAWTEAVEWTRDDAEHLGQSADGRLWDVLSVLRFHTAMAGLPGRKPTDRVHFKVSVVPNTGVTRWKKLVELWARSHPGDDGEHVLTILLNGED